MASARGRASGGQGAVGDDDMRRVDLVGGEQTVRLDVERRRHARAIFRDMGGAVARADTAIEAGIEAAGDAALPREEGVADAGKRKGLGLDHHR